MSATNDKKESAGIWAKRYAKYAFSILAKNYIIRWKATKPMRPDLLTDLFKKEEIYWWNVCKREMVLSLLGSMGLPESRGKLGRGIDLGCGGGYTAKHFESNWLMVGADVSRDALWLSKKRGVRNLCQIDLTEFSLPFKTGLFDLVLALDVIEHVEDDTHALAECHRVLKGGGLLIVTVPAFMALWGPWDEALGHRRRYTAYGLSQAAQEAGLSIARLTYIFCFIFPAAASIRLLKKLLQKEAAQYSTDFIQLPAMANGLLIWIGRLEQFLVSRLHLSLPFGLSVISAMRKNP